ncbi:MAG: hypothetical protein JXB39_01180 [Deltaproteobacteria bacterium]|nr:hypothetical protein [Deltaproteobacteria bacterium]
MRKLLLTTLFLAVPTGQAIAGAWEAKTMRQPLANREVERPLILTKGWLQFDLGVDWKVAQGYWTSEGEAADFEYARWTYTTERIGIQYGVTNRSELEFAFPVHYLRLENDTLGTDTRDFGLGDPSFTYTFEVLRRTAPLTSVVLYGHAKLPAGNESPGEYIGGPNAITKFVMTSGTFDYTLGAAAKQQAGPVAIRLGGGYTYRQAAVVQYLVEIEQYQFAGRIKPGDVLHGTGGLTIQAGPVALDGAVTGRMRGETRIGTTGEGGLGNDQLDAVAASDGWSLDATASLIVQPSRGIDLIGGVGIPLRGEDLQFFPIEDIHPTRGLTYSGTLQMRF